MDRLRNAILRLNFTWDDWQTTQHDLTSKQTYNQTAMLARWVGRGVVGLWEAGGKVSTGLHGETQGKVKLINCLHPCRCRTRFRTEARRADRGSSRAVARARAGRTRAYARPPHPRTTSCPRTIVSPAEAGVSSRPAGPRGRRRAARLVVRSLVVAAVLQHPPPLSGRLARWEVQGARCIDCTNQPRFIRFYIE